MKASVKTTTATFLKPFVVPALNEVLPPGEYILQTELSEASGIPDPESLKASVMVHLHPTPGSPGLARTLTIPLKDLEHALARDKLSGKPLVDFLLAEMLADPLVRLFMDADGVTDDQMRRLHGGSDANGDGER